MPDINFIGRDFFSLNFSINLLSYLPYHGPKDNKLMLKFKELDEKQGPQD